MELLLVKPKVKSLGYDEIRKEEKFEISPLEAGQAGGVFGNSLRTTLLSNIPGYAVTNFQIGYRFSDKEEYTYMPHIFDTVPGVTPDLAAIFMNVKKALFKLKGCKEKDLTVVKKGVGAVTLADFSEDGVEIINPEHKLFDITDSSVEITFTIKVQEGRGYKDETTFDMEDWISVDANYTPVDNVMSEVDSVRVNGEEGYQKLILTIRTNGKMEPKECLSVAIRIIQEGYTVLLDGALDVIENEQIYFDVKEEKVAPIVYKNLGELGLSVRAFNALSAAGINNTGDFERYTAKQIRELPNLGKTTFKELIDKLAEISIELKK